MAASGATRTRSWSLPAPHRHEAFHVQTALVGLAGALTATVWLLGRSTTPDATLAFGLYGGALALLFATTALHHLWPENVLLTRLDQASIYAAIAGTAAPPCLLVAGPAGEWAFGIIAILCVLGACAKLATPVMPPTWNLLVYVPVPLPVLLVARDLVGAVPGWALALLAGGTLVFLAGALVDALRLPSPKRIGPHGMFHISVLLGCAMTFGFVAACA